MVEAPVEFVRPREPKPAWLKVRAPGSENYLRLKGVMKELKLHTVCEEARKHLADLKKVHIRA